MALRTLLCLALVLAPACRGTAESYQAVPMPNLEVDVPPSDSARIYVMRDDQMRGKVRTMRVQDSNSEVGIVGPGEFLCWERSPGRALVSVLYEGPRIDRGDMEGILSLDAMAGNAYYLLIQLSSESDAPEMRASAGQPQIKLVDAMAGRELVRARKPVPVR